MSKRLTWLKNEAFKLLPAFLYFAVTFNLIHLALGLMLPPGSHRVFNYWTITLGALIVCKVIFIANYLSFINAFPNKPLIYNIAWKFLIYVSCVFIFELIEHFLELSYRYKDVGLACENIFISLCEPYFWATLIGFSLVFMVYIVASEFVRVLGALQVKKILLG